MTNLPAGAQSGIEQQVQDIVGVDAAGDALNPRLGWGVDDQQVRGRLGPQHPRVCRVAGGGGDGLVQGVDVTGHTRGVKPHGRAEH